VSLQITEMYAFVAVDRDGDEGIIGMRAPDGSWMPLVGADKARVESLRSIAREIARASHREVRLLRFSVREELEVLR
jgi:hypothetical protein